MEQAKIQVWTPKYLGQKYNFRAPCGCPLRLYGEVVVKLKPVCEQFVESEAKLPSGPFVQLSLFAVLQVLACGKIYIVYGEWFLSLWPTFI